MTISTPAIGGGRPRLPLRWLAVLVGGMALFALIQAVLRNTGNPVYVPTLLLLGAAVVPATFATFFHELFGRPQLPAGMLAAGALLGGTVAIVVAGQLEADTVRSLGEMPTLLVGLIEESAKLAVPLLLLLMTRRRVSAEDGLVLGVAVGSGFAVLETMGYAFVELFRAHGQLAPLTDLLVLRALSSPGGHAAWTGLACAALFGIGAASTRWRGWIRFALTFAGVVILHAAWDASLSSSWHVVIGLLSFAVLLGAAFWLRSTPRSGNGHPRGMSTGAAGPTDVPRPVAMSGHGTPGAGS